jgi:hypothetical protein
MPSVQGIVKIRARQPHLNQTFVLGMHGSSNVTLHIKRSKKFSNEDLSYKKQGIFTLLLKSAMEITSPINRLAPLKE